MLHFRNESSLKEFDSVSLAMRLRDHFRESFPIRHVERLDNAIQLASYLHRYDVRRGGRGKLPNPPYIEHPLRVTLRMAETFGVTDPDVLIAGILHDTVEDHPWEFHEMEGVRKATTPEEAEDFALDYINQHFGRHVSLLVSYVTNPLLPVGTDKAEKVKRYHEHVSSVLHLHPTARIIKFSDFVDNAGSLHHHYAYDDIKVKYFIERYEPLIPLYRKTLEFSRSTYHSGAALNRLQVVEDQFEEFRRGLGLTPKTN